MDVPLEISFHNLEHSDAVEAKIRARVERLNKRYDRMIACRVTIEAPQKRHRKGNLFNVRIDISVPGGELVINREPHHAAERYRDPNLYRIISDAFHAAEQKLIDFKQRQRGEVKPIEAELVGRITDLHAERDYGFLATPDGKQLYFHRNSLPDDGFDKLSVGDRVQYVETLGATGPQASRVWRH